MKLKFRPIGLEAGKPIAFINGESSKISGIFEGTRIEAIAKNKKIILPVNIVDKLLNEDEISFSEEAVSFLKIKKGEEVNVFIAPSPLTTRMIMKKLSGKELTREEIYSIIKDIVNNALNEPEIAYFVAAVYHNGMTIKETIYLTEAMAKTGKILKWKNKNVADKHSIGGVPNNRTTPIVVSICAAAGLIMPKTSSRAITTPAGTADVIETITNVCLSAERLKKVVEKTNACLAWGGSLGMAPADDKLIRVERLLNIDPESQLLASILAKKISVGSKYVLIDIPYGNGAKVSIEKAKKLKKKFEEIGKYFKIKIEVVLTDGSQPIGNGIGPMLEMEDVLKVLKRENPPVDLEKKSIFLSGKILEAFEKTKKGKGEIFAREILDSKKALKKFEEIVSAQGKKDYKFKLPNFRYSVIANKTGKISCFYNKNINQLARYLGCPENKSAGIYLLKHKNDLLEKNETIAFLYAETKQKLEEGKRFLKTNKIFELI